MAGMRVSRRLLSERMKAGRGCLQVEKLRARKSEGVRRRGERAKGVKTKSTKSKSETGLGVQ